jgi:hypothetical protein
MRRSAAVEQDRRCKSEQTSRSFISRGILCVLKDINTGDNDEGSFSPPNCWGVVAARMAQKRVWNRVTSEEECSEPVMCEGERVARRRINVLVI